MTLSQASAGSTLAEGYSASVVDGSIETGFRMFTIYSLEKACSQPHMPVSLVAKDLELDVGDTFTLSKLLVNALDDNGEFIPSVPIVITGEVDSNVIYHDPAFDQESYVARHAGSVSFAVVYLCPSAQPVKTEFRIHVRSKSGLLPPRSSFQEGQS
ncbi:hypothetical protein [Congregibacter litoralis]|nr:hypothetical protein [Congregibacter litoralis]